MIKEKIKEISIHIMVILAIGSFINFIYEKHQPVEIFDTKVRQGTIFEDATKSNYFKYTYTVWIDKTNIGNEGVSISFEVDITPITEGKFKRVIATAFMDEKVCKQIHLENFRVFGTDKEEKILMDKSNPNAQGVSIAKNLGVSKHTNWNELTRILKRGIDVKVSWKNEVEYVHISDVNINLE